MKHEINFDWDWDQSKYVVLEFHIENKFDNIFLIRTPVWPHAKLYVPNTDRKLNMYITAPVADVQGW